MMATTFEIRARNLYQEHCSGNYSYAEYSYRFARLRGELQSFSLFRINGGSQEEYDRVRSAVHAEESERIRRLIEAKEIGR